MMSLFTKLKESKTRLFLWLMAGGAISIIAGLTMVTDEVWGGHRCHLVMPEKIE